MPATKNKTSPALVPVADVALDEEAQEMLRARIEAVGEDIYVDLNLEPAELADAAARSMNMAARNIAIAGLKFARAESKNESWRLHCRHWNRATFTQKRPAGR